LNILKTEGFFNDLDGFVYKAGNLFCRHRCNSLLREENVKIENFDCICYSPYHTIRFILDDDPDWVSLSLEVQLVHHKGFLKRLYYGIKYILGMKSKEGHWAGWELKEDDAERLMLLLDKYVSAKNLTRPETSKDIVKNVKMWSKMSDSELRLHCGELTAQEIRSIRAILYAIKRT